MKNNTKSRKAFSKYVNVIYLEVSFTTSPVYQRTDFTDFITIFRLFVLDFVTLDFCFDITCKLAHASCILHVKPRHILRYLILVVSIPSSRASHQFQRQKMHQTESGDWQFV